MNNKTIRLIDTFALAGVCFSLIEAFYYQLIQGELPCAFCNLIRVAFMLFGAGLLLNLRFGTNRWNYVLSAAGALISALISLLFMFAKAPPSTTPTGSAIFGLHMYTWSFIIFMGAIMYCVVLLALSDNRGGEANIYARMPRLVSLMAVLFVVLTGGNLLSAFLQNGFGTFRAGGQQHYEMLYNGDVMKP